MQRIVGTMRALHGSRVGAAVRGCAGSIACVGGSAIAVQAALEGREVVAMEAPHPVPTSDGLLAAVLRDDPFGGRAGRRIAMRRNLKPHGGGAARPRVSNHELPPHCSSRTTATPDPAKIGVKPTKLGRGQQPISLSRAAPCHRMRIHGRCRPNRRVHHRPTERRLLR